MSLLPAVAIVVLALAALAAAVAWKRRPTVGDDLFPFEQSAPLTEREQVLYWRLRKVLPGEIVLAQVAMSRLLRVRRGHNVRAWMNRIDRMTIDFVVCLPDSTIVAAVELDDASHGSPVRIEQDDKKNRALEAAGIKLLRFANVPDEAQLRKAFLE